MGKLQEGAVHVDAYMRAGRPVAGYDRLVKELENLGNADHPTSMVQLPGGTKIIPDKLGRSGAIVGYELQTPSGESQKFGIGLPGSRDRLAQIAVEVDRPAREKQRHAGIEGALDKLTPGGRMKIDLDPEIAAAIGGDPAKASTVPGAPSAGSRTSGFADTLSGARRARAVSSGEVRPAAGKATGHPVGPSPRTDIAARRPVPRVPGAPSTRSASAPATTNEGELRDVPGLAGWQTRLRANGNVDLLGPGGKVLATDLTRSAAKGRANREAQKLVRRAQRGR